MMADVHEQAGIASQALPSIPPTQPADPKLEPTQQESAAAGVPGRVERPTAEIMKDAPAQPVNQPTAGHSAIPSSTVQLPLQQAANPSGSVPAQLPTRDLQPSAAVGSVPGAAAAAPLQGQQTPKQGTQVVAANGVPTKAPGQLPVRPYLETTVVPVLMQALQQLVRERPEDPLGYVADYLNTNNPKRQKKA